ncbi:type IX secretion system outer membrane channel protein PorV [Myroides sp. 1354]|uniref:type IX secretion system outer membrane channel protein PorV n=1 Tax=unclassified Myroides TaxID=2642485 RepID=UPI0025751206|nr:MULTISPECIES: type IX secretion system outer membrane channel protein PorV [unclassified Myroides]MDM1045741.1 type IX secretion system outer membrane channel protein PorV [Myroides sp. R163-1]MDM1056743.1 type IX secretion system outer membrane channel protein PorV [Myroides sp. 1354]MDM1070536.1 type IX secretion system outer membrane channel protein PorV [Myroides sp. 1372]
MKNFTALVLSILGGSALYAQKDMHPITTGVPFLTIAADARSAAMGDMGVATTTDAFSQQHNASKYAFALKDQGFALSYTPYMSKISSGMSLAQANYYNKFNERSAFSVGFRYFGMGEVTYREDYNSIGATYKPSEFAIDASYALKLSEKFGMAVTGRFINSNLKLPDTGDGDASSASTFAVDISGFYQSDRMAFSDFDGRWRFGFNLQNLGPKISYSDKPTGDFLPANLKLGAGFDFILDDYNTLTIATEFNKLLVPTPPADVTDPEEMRKYNDTGWFKGVFKSFGDAPGGFSEEMKEVAWALGAEYWYDNTFAFRAGYFNENKNKGARQYATLGAGFKYSMITVDLSYLFSTSKINNPLENTLRFSLTFDLGRKTYPKG